MPAYRYRALVRGGGIEVTGSELTRTLISSGLRVPLKECPPQKIRARLITAWDALVPAMPHSAPGKVPNWANMSRELLHRWEHPHRAYHNSAPLRYTHRPYRPLQPTPATATTRPGCAPNTHYPEEAFIHGRTGFLRDYLVRERIYTSQDGHRLWDAAVRTNMIAELQSYRPVPPSI